MISDKQCASKEFDPIKLIAKSETHKRPFTKTHLAIGFDTKHLSLGE